jgi:phage terminase large subunit
MIVGMVCPVKGLLHIWHFKGGKWNKRQSSDAEDIDAYLPSKLEPVLLSNKRFIVVIGGRGSGKSVGIADICLIDAVTTGSKTYCLREFQSSIKNSVHSLLKEEQSRLGFEGFDVQAQSILYEGREAFQFAGLSRNVDSIKSAHGFKRYWCEESQFISEDSLTALTPTARKKPKKGMPTVLEDDIEDNSEDVSMIFVANPGSSEDPFSQRFIVPFQDELDANGFYEDDMHLVVVMNHEDNPWYAESGLEAEREWDYKNRSRALYDHIWLGKYNDSVENSLIQAEWFDACIDAHKKLGFQPRGVVQAAHDPSDMGGDSKGFAIRHGSVINFVDEKKTGNINEGGDWATGLAIQHRCDSYTWDCDGMGVGLSRQTAQAFEGKRVDVAMFKGSESPDMPDAIYEPVPGSGMMHQKTWKETCKNKRAQYYLMLRDRCYRTYRAVVHGEYHDPDTLISFSSEITILNKLRAELCRMPIKPNGNGLFELYTKDAMKAKFNLTSPNLGDSVMMLMRQTHKVQMAPVMPQPIKTMGRWC